MATSEISLSHQNHRYEAKLDATIAASAKDKTPRGTTTGQVTSGPLLRHYVRLPSWPGLRHARISDQVCDEGLAGFPLDALRSPAPWTLKVGSDLAVGTSLSFLSSLLTSQRSAAKPIESDSSSNSTTLTALLASETVPANERDAARPADAGRRIGAGFLNCRTGSTPTTLPALGRDKRSCGRVAFGQGSGTATT